LGGQDIQICTCRYWELLILAFVVYNAVTVPHEAAFVYDKSKIQSLIEDIIDVLFAIDVLFTFRVAYINSQGELVRDGRQIVSHYLYTWFPIDLLASLPFEYIVLAFGLEGGSNWTFFAFFKEQLPSLLQVLM
jgi:potassium channel